MIPITAPTIGKAAPLDLAAVAPDAGAALAGFEQLVAGLFAPVEGHDQSLPGSPSTVIEEPNAGGVEGERSVSERSIDDPLAAIFASLPISVQMPIAQATEQPVPTAVAAPQEAVAAVPLPLQVSSALTLESPTIQAARPSAEAVPVSTPATAKSTPPLAVVASPESAEAAALAATALPLLRLVREKAEPTHFQAPPESLAAPSAALPPAFAIEASPVLASQPIAPQQVSSTAIVQPDATAQVVEQQLDLAHESEWLDRLARDIAGAADKDGTLRFRLNPETLGALKVEVTQGSAGASVRLTADTETARTIIADAQPRLVAEARAQGVRIAETHVDLGTQGGSSDPRRQSGAQAESLVRTAGTDSSPESAAEQPDNELYA